MEKEENTKRESKNENILYLFKKSNGRRAGVRPVAEQDCIRCGRCLEVCTEHLNPSMLAR